MKRAETTVTRTTDPVKSPQILALLFQRGSPFTGVGLKEVLTALVVERCCTRRTQDMPGWLCCNPCRMGYSEWQTRPRKRPQRHGHTWSDGSTRTMRHRWSDEARRQKGVVGDIPFAEG